MLNRKNSRKSYTLMKMMTMRAKLIKKKEKKVKNRRVHNNLMMMMARMTTSLGLLIKI